MKRQRKIGDVTTTAVANGVATVAARRYAAAFMERGGGAGRARSEVRKGKSFSDAAAIASKQSKGHMAELRVAAQQSLDSGLKAFGSFSRPNAVANDQHVDVEVVADEMRRLGAQIGVGTPAYLRRKAQRSLAEQVVVNVEGREALRQIDPLAYARTADRLSYGDTASGVLRSADLEAETKSVLLGVLQGNTRVTEWSKVASAAGAGIHGGVIAFARHLLFAVARRIANRESIDHSVLEEAARVGRDAFLRGVVETYIHVADFLAVAGDAFDGELLRRMGNRVLIASAVVDVVVETAKDVVAWSRNEISGEALGRRLGVSCCAAVGSVAGSLLAARVAKSFGALAPLVMLLGAWGGGKLGEFIGEKIFVDPDFGTKALVPVP